MKFNCVSCGITDHHDDDICGTCGKYVHGNGDKILSVYLPKGENLIKCDFEDECDFCKSPENGSYVKLYHVPEDVTETEYYICGKCIVKKYEI